MEGLRHMNLYPRLEPDANEEGTQDDSALMASDKKRVSPVSLRSGVGMTKIFGWWAHPWAD